MIRTMTSPDHAHVTFVLAVLFIPFCGLLIFCPPLAVLIVVVSIIKVRSRAAVRKVAFETAIARRKSTWGY